MKFYIASRRNEEPIKEFLTRANIPFSDEPEKIIGDGDTGAQISIFFLSGLKSIQARVEKLLGKPVRLVVDMNKAEIVIYDFYID